MSPNYVVPNKKSSHLEKLTGIVFRSSGWSEALQAFSGPISETFCHLGRPDAAPEPNTERKRIGKSRSDAKIVWPVIRVGNIQHWSVEVSLSAEPV